MKLAAFYNRWGIIVSASVLLISGLIYYLIINHIARQQLDSDLTEEVEEVVDYVNQNHRLPKSVDFDEDVTSFLKTNKVVYDTRFYDAPYANPRERKTDPGRAVSALVKVNGENFIVTIVESRENTEYLIQIISGITLILTAVLLGILAIMNKFVLNGLWKPFYNILNQVKWFNISDTNLISPVETEVDEFKELSNAVSTMSSRATIDYQGLKTFTENASHEMMTPLAIITSKLDMLIQDEMLQPDQFNQINDIYAAAARLSRLNQSLLLLVKIDNNLIQDTAKLNIRQMIIEKARQFNEMIAGKKINLEMELDDTEVNAGKYLMEALINNLFSNAVRHNKNPGSIKIILLENSLEFKNTGENVALQEDYIFKRFYKGHNSEGTGLGLAIIKNICNCYNFNIKYNFENGLHCFLVNF